MDCAINGRLELNRIDVASLYSGRVKAVLVEEGADVKEGDILAELSSETSNSRLEEARAAELRQEEAVGRAKAAEAQMKQTVARAQANVDATGSSCAWRKWSWTMRANCLPTSWCRNRK